MNRRTTTPQKLIDCARPCTHHPWVARLPHVLGEAHLAMLLALYLLANRKSGRVLVQKEVLGEMLGVDGKEVESRLRALHASGQIAIKNDNSYLVLFIQLWPRSASRISSSAPSDAASTAESALQSSAEESSGASAGAGPQDKAGAERRAGSGVRGPERGDARRREFVDRLLTVMGAPEERSSYDAFCRKYSPDVLEAALRRVEETPMHQIRKSRGALFTFLVKTMSRENQQQ